MQISRRNKLFKIIITVVFIVIAVIAINEFMCFALEPDDRSSESKAMWKNYREQGELDTVYAGSSFCLVSFDPEVIDAEAGTKSYNMGTYGQPLPQSYIAIKTAIKEHHVKNVVLAIGYYALRDSDKSTNAEVTFLHAQAEGQSLVKKVKIGLEYITQADNITRGVSLNYFSPWVYNHVNFSPPEIADNLRNKLNGKYEKEGWEDSFRKGCVTENGTLDYNDHEQTDRTSKAMYGNSAASHYGFDQLDRICNLCNKNGCRLIVINTPRPAYDVLSYGTKEYFNQKKALTSFLNERGALYYDFNFAKPELFESNDDYFVSSEHLNAKGAEEFSRSFGKFMGGIIAGKSEEKLNKEFNSSEEYMDTIDYISSVELNCEEDDDGMINAKATAYTGSKVIPEYEFLVKYEGESSYTVMKEFSTSNSFIYKPENQGVYYLRVNVREKGSNNEFDRYSVKDITAVQ